MGPERPLYLHEAFDWTDRHTLLVFVGHGIVLGCVAGLMAIICHVGALLLATDEQEFVAVGLLVPVFVILLLPLVLGARSGSEKAKLATRFLTESDLNVTIAHEKSVGLIILWILIIYAAMWVVYGGFAQILDDREMHQGLFIGAVLLTSHFQASLQNALARRTPRAPGRNAPTRPVGTADPP